MNKSSRFPAQFDGYATKRDSSKNWGGEGGREQWNESIHVDNKG